MVTSRSLHALLDQTGWIHALARSLVADPHLAADLAQDTTVDALEARPDGSRPLRAWLATVMRNNLAKLRRGESNRGAREESVRRADRAPAAQEVVERAEAHRNVVQAVLALGEPYRSTLLMRFFEQLSYDEIAAKTGVTRAAVNSRVTRGLAELRARLESTYGDRRALCLALIPLAQLPTGLATIPPTTFLGLKTMHFAIGTAAATLVAATVSVSVLGGREPSSHPLRTPVNELEPAALAVPAQLVHESEFGPVQREAVLPQENPQRQEDSDGNTWRAELFHSQALPASVEGIAVSSGAGDVEVTASTSGRLEVQARVRAKLGIVKGHELTQVFTDHVDITEEDGTLVIEGAHQDERGWSVALVVSVPGAFPIQANSGAGNVVVRTGRGTVKANSGAGAVRVELPHERLEEVHANSGAGEVEVDVSTIAGALRANSGAGEVRARVGEALEGSELELTSGAGNVLLVVPADVIGRFALQTHGEIEVPPALGLAIKRDVSGRTRAKGTLGNGGGSYELRSGAGDLRIGLGHRLPAKDE